MSQSSPIHLHQSQAWRSDRPPTTLIESASAQLQNDILEGKFFPGSNLHINALKQQYDVSASTVREALSRLIASGLVVSEGQRGFRTAQMSIEDLEDITRMRKLLEITAVTEAIETAGEDWEASIVSAYYRLNKLEKQLSEVALNHPNLDELKRDWEQRNQAFHFAIISGCKSRRLHRFYSILYHQSLRYRFRHFSFSQSIPVRDVEAEHTAIFEAVMKRDVELACKYAGEHIEKTVNAVREAGSAVVR